MRKFVRIFLFNFFFNFIFSKERQEINAKFVLSFFFVNLVA